MTMKAFSQPSAGFDIRMCTYQAPGRHCRAPPSALQGRPEAASALGAPSSRRPCPLRAALQAPRVAQRGPSATSRQETPTSCRQVLCPATCGAFSEVDDDFVVVLAGLSLNALSAHRAGGSRSLQQSRSCSRAASCDFSALPLWCETDLYGALQIWQSPRGCQTPAA